MQNIQRFCFTVEWIKKKKIEMHIESTRIKRPNWTIMFCNEITSDREREWERERDTLLRMQLHGLQAAINGERMASRAQSTVNDLYIFVSFWFSFYAQSFCRAMIIRCNDRVAGSVATNKVKENLRRNCAIICCVLFCLPRSLSLSRAPRLWLFVEWTRLCSGCITKCIMSTVCFALAH